MVSAVIVDANKPGLLILTSDALSHFLLIYWQFEQLSCWYILIKKKEGRVSRSCSLKLSPLIKGRDVFLEAVEFHVLVTCEPKL